VRARRVGVDFLPEVFGRRMVGRTDGAAFGFGGIGTACDYVAVGRFLRRLCELSPKSRYAAQQLAFGARASASRGDRAARFTWKTSRADSTIIGESLRHSFSNSCCCTHANRHETPK
jgi:hypothetical protein